MLTECQFWVVIVCVITETGYGFAIAAKWNSTVNLSPATLKNSVVFTLLSHSPHFFSKMKNPWLDISQSGSLEEKVRRQRALLSCNCDIHSAQAPPADKTLICICLSDTNRIWPVLALLQEVFRASAASSLTLVSSLNRLVQLSVRAKLLPKLKCFCATCVENILLFLCLLRQLWKMLLVQSEHTFYSF